MHIKKILLHTVQMLYSEAMTESKTNNEWVKSHKVEKKVPERLMEILDEKTPDAIVELAQRAIFERPHADWEALGYTEENGCLPLIKSIEAYLNSPVIEDGFENDDVSRDIYEKYLEDTLTVEEYDEYKVNRYRPNGMNEMIMSFSILPYAVPEEKRLQNQLLRIFDTLSKIPTYSRNSYKRLDLKTKRLVVAQYSLAAVTALRLLKGDPVKEENYAFIEATTPAIDRECILSLPATVSEVLTTFDGILRKLATEPHSFSPELFTKLQQSVVESGSLLKDINNLLIKLEGSGHQENEEIKMSLHTMATEENLEVIEKLEPLIVKMIHLLEETQSYVNGINVNDLPKEHVNHFNTFKNTLVYVMEKANYLVSQDAA
jgi:hypothetical protein